MRSVQQQRQAASLEADQRWMETLASRRRELQQALQEQSSDSRDESWMGTNKASFFLVPKEPVTNLLEKELAEVEEELRRVCDSIMKATQEE